MEKQNEIGKEHKENIDKGAKTIELFLQGEGIKDIALIQIPDEKAKVPDIIEAAKSGGLSISEDNESFSVFVEGENEEALDPNASLESIGIRHRSRIHVHRCRKIEVTVNFNGRQEFKAFPPSATIHRIKHWAVSDKGFNLSELDASEHALQICGSSVRPDEETHIGSLVIFPTCNVCFDLVPKQRVEGGHF